MANEVPEPPRGNKWPRWTAFKMVATYTACENAGLRKARYSCIDNVSVEKQNCSLKTPLPSTSPFHNSWNALLFQNCFLILSLFYFCLSLQSLAGFTSFLLNFFFPTVIPLICFPFLPAVNFLYFSCLLSPFHFYLLFILFFECLSPCS